MKRLRFAMWEYVMLAAVLVAGGYGSNVVTKQACLMNAVTWFSYVIVQGRHLYIEAPSDREDIERAMREAGAKYTLLTSESDDQAYPRASITIRSWVPYIVSIQFRLWRDGKLSGGFTAHYLCLFGTPLSVGDRFELPEQTSSRSPRYLGNDPRPFPPRVVGQIIGLGCGSLI